MLGMALSAVAVLNWQSPANSWRVKMSCKVAGGYPTYDREFPAGKETIMLPKRAVVRMHVRDFRLVIGTSVRGSRFLDLLTDRYSRIRRHWIMIGYG